MTVIFLLLCLFGTSFCLTGILICAITFFRKVSNGEHQRKVVVSPRGFLFLFLGIVSFSFTDIYDQKWGAAIVHFSTSILYLCIYIILNKSYKLKLEDENR